MARRPTPEQLEAESDALLVRFATWVRDADRAEDAALALDYKLAMGATELTTWISDDVDALLFGYLPENVFVEDDEEADDLLESLALFVEFLGAERLLAKGSDGAGATAGHIRSHRQDFREAMADPDVRSPSKRILAAMLNDGIDLEDQAAIEQWLDDFNEGPIERRDQILGGPLDDLYEEFDDEESEIVLPARRPVDPEIARRSAASAPLVAKIAGLAEYMGDGRPLTQTGNLKRADARHLVSALDTGDITDHNWGGKERPFRSAAELKWLDMVVWFATEIGAVRVEKSKMRGISRWLRRHQDSPLEVAAELATLLFEVGPLTALMGDFFHSDAARLAIDSMPVALLAKLYEEPEEFDWIAEMMAESLSHWVEVDRWYSDPERGFRFFQESVERDLERISRVMEWAGVLVWKDPEPYRDRLIGLPRMRGGTLAITPFGEWMIQNPLHEVGCVVAPVVKPLEVTLDDPPEAIVEGLAAYLDVGSEALAEAWAQLRGYEGLPEQLWRVEHPDTVKVLEALGSALPDRKTAKAARKASLKHRSWLASRGG